MKELVADSFVNKIVWDIKMNYKLLNKGIVVPLEGDKLINFINSFINGEKINDLVLGRKLRSNE
jgi:hypothetical protein